MKARLTGARTTKTIISTMRKVAPKINHNITKEKSKRTERAVNSNMRTTMKMMAMAASQSRRDSWALESPASRLKMM